ncbi:MAG TPA: hypothetical protein VKU40_15165 [Thermoanaerobaculia bacterium]|nr:hypothetical protein [Thermoanaerobaculia bacterium]
MAASSHRLTPLLLAVLSVAALVALFAGGTWGGYAFAAVSALFPGALILFAARRHGKLGGAAAGTAVALSAVLAGSFTLLFLVGHWLGGGIPSLVILFGGVWFLPLLFVGLAYAFGFAAHGVSAEDLERLRALRRAGDHAAEGG